MTVRSAAAKVTCFITALDEVVDADAISDVRLDQTLNELAGTLEGALRASRLQSGGTQFTMKMQRGVLDQFITALKHALGLPSVLEMENKFDLGMLLGVLQIAAMSRSVPDDSRPSINPQDSVLDCPTNKANRAALHRTELNDADGVCRSACK